MENYMYMLQGALHTTQWTMPWQSEKKNNRTTEINLRLIKFTAY